MSVDASHSSVSLALSILFHSSAASRTVLDKAVSCVPYLSRGTLQHLSGSLRVIPVLKMDDQKTCRWI